MNIKNLDLNALKVLHSLLSTGSTKETALDLGLSQPAISHILNKLREQLNDPLFVRHGRSLAATPKAIELKRPLGEILKRIEIEVLGEGGFDPTKEEFSLTLATYDVCSTHLLPQIIKAAKKEAPHFNLKVRRLEEGFIDLPTKGYDFLINALPLNSANLFQSKIKSDRFVCMGKKNHPFFKNPSLDYYLEFEHIMVAPFGREGSWVDDLLNKNQRRKVALTVASALEVPFYLINSSILCVVNEDFAKEAKKRFNLDYVDHPFPQKGMAKGFSYYLTWHEQTHKNPAHIWFRQLIKNL